MTAWAEFLGGWLAGATALALLAAAAAAVARPARVRLAAWRTAIVGLCLVPAAAAGGLGGALRDALAPRPSVGAASIVLQPGVAAPHDRLPTGPPVTWPVLVWAVGAALVLGRQAATTALLWRLHRRLRGGLSAELRERVEGVARRVGLTRSVEVGVAPGLQGPLVFGVWRPVLAVPADFESTFSPAQQTAVIAHELGHLANRDPLWHLAATLAVALNWWNPLAWWVRSRHRDAGEFAADEATRFIDDGPGLLAECLVLLGQRLAAGAAAGSLAAVGAGLRSGLARRVQRLLHMPPDDGRRPRLRHRLVMAGLAAVVGATAVIAPAWASPGGGAHWRRSLAGRAWHSRSRPPADPLVEPVRRRAGAAAPLQRATAPVAADRRTDAKIVSRLGLTDNQLSRFQALQADVAARTREMHRLKSGHVERGLEINRHWRAGLQSIFTADQYQRYLDYWRGPALARPVGG